jgi:hypothetical protein
MLYYYYLKDKYIITDKKQHYLCDKNFKQLIYKVMNALPKNILNFGFLVGRKRCFGRVIIVNEIL